MGAEGIRKRGQAANPSETATPQDSSDTAAAAASVDGEKSQKGKDRQRRCRWCFVLAVWFGGLCAVLAVAWLFCQSIVRVAAAAVRNLCCVPSTPNMQDEDDKSFVSTNVCRYGSLQPNTTWPFTIATAMGLAGWRPSRVFATQAAAARANALLPRPQPRQSSPQAECARRGFCWELPPGPGLIAS